jgi:hypothetical protein
MQIERRGVTRSRRAKDGLRTGGFRLSAPLEDTLLFACVAALSVFIAGSELLQTADLNEKIASLAREYRQLADTA